MEYRRRRNGRQARGTYRSAQFSRRSGGDGGSIFNILLLVVMAAGLVYVFIATPVGAMISGNIFGKPRSAQVTPSPSPNTDSDHGADASNTAAPANSFEKAEIALPPLELYALQLGVYDSASNAQGLISSLRSLGAAGYALATDEGVRIITSCYNTEAAANSVCSRLTEQGYSGMVYPIKCDGAILTVIASEQQLSAIREAAELARQLIDRMNDEVIRFDSEERSIEYGAAVTNEMLERVRVLRELLDGINDPSGAVELMKEHFIELTGCFTRFSSVLSENRVEFSGRFKHLQLEIIERYCALTGKLQGLADH